MHSRLLFSADDERRSDFERQLARPASHRVGGLSAPSAVQDLLRRFNPRLVGFGIVGPLSSHFSGMSELTDTTQSQNVDSKEGQEAE